MKILACVDFSPAASAVVELAGRLAIESGATVTLMHAAAPEPSLVGYDEPGGPASIVDRVHELSDEVSEMRRQTDDLGQRGATTADPILRVGPTTETILEVADEIGADLIVVARHRHGPLHNLLLGNTAEAVVRHSKRPVVVVPAS